jgi:hypothetical protein
VPRPTDWVDHVNGLQSEEELNALRRCSARGTPFGTTEWVKATAVRLGLEFTTRPRGRPRPALSPTGPTIGTFEEAPLFRSVEGSPMESQNN